MSSRANDAQISGTHYRSSFQHWDLIEQNGIGYLEGCATKYVTRWRKKNGIDDLRKARHYLEKLIELHALGDRSPRGSVNSNKHEEFCSANALDPMESVIIWLICSWRTAGDLLQANRLISSMIEDAEKITPVTGGDEF